MSLRGPRVVAAGLLLTGAWMTWSMRPVVSDAHTASRAEASTTPLPTVPGWERKPLETDRRTIEILETPDVTLAEYTRASEELPVWFAHVGGVGTRAAFHPPELCYVGSHYEVLERGKLRVPVRGQMRDVMRLVISQDGRKFEAWYWFTANQRVTANYYTQQAWLMRDALVGRASTGALTRISTPLDDPAKATARLAEFLGAMTTGG